MLFDLRSRGRRHTVRVIYLFLALVMAGGLVLVGVGTGSSGGLLNAFTNGSSSGGGSQFADQVLHKAIKATEKNPRLASNWSSLLAARLSAASSGSNYNSTTGVYSASGKKQLQQGVVAWQHYLKARGNKPPLGDTSLLGNSSLAATVYQKLGQWSGAASAWEHAATTQPSGSSTALKPFECLAFASYAAKLTGKGDLAAAQAVKLTPKLQRLTLSSTFKQVKSSASSAQQALIQEC
ncbi:MAG TPA: hypothetical protein VMV16_09165 [Solirubrobacteraceae bacterium]|nr:hypothetical protein [Solirubrobacteraceae bacterium]